MGLSLLFAKKMQRIELLGLNNQGLTLKRPQYLQDFHTETSWEQARNRELRLTISRYDMLSVTETVRFFVCLLLLLEGKGYYVWQARYPGN